MTAPEPTPGRTLLRALVAIGWTYRSWEDSTEAERAGLEAAAGDVIAAQEPKAAPELAALRDYLGQHRAVISDMLNHFRATGNGWKASARITELRRWHDIPGIERPQELRDAE